MGRFEGAQVNIISPQEGCSNHISLPSVYTLQTRLPDQKVKICNTDQQCYLQQGCTYSGQTSYGFHPQTVMSLLQKNLCALLCREIVFHLEAEAVSVSRAYFTSHSDNLQASNFVSHRCITKSSDSVSLLKVVT